MRRRLTKGVTVFRIRSAERRDHANFVALYTRYMAVSPSDPAAPNFERWERELLPGMLVAEKHDDVVGYVHCELLEHTGYVHQLVVDEAVRRQGLGLDLMQALAERLQQQGIREWCLNVRPGDSGAVRLYEKVGLRPIHAVQGLRVPWRTFEELPGRQDMAQARIVDPADDARIEQTMGILAGQLARARARPERVLIALYDADEPVGIAVFARAEARAMPFRVARAELAGVLGRELAHHSLPGQDELYVAVEDDAALVRLLLDAGASVVREVQHYRGAIVPSY